MTDRRDIEKELRSALEWCSDEDDPNGSVAVKIWVIRDALQYLQEQLEADLCKDCKRAVLFTTPGISAAPEG